VSCASLGERWEAEEGRRGTSYKERNVEARDDGLSSRWDAAGRTGVGSVVLDAGELYTLL
jgi:hypothetical protein